jgi:hypothetical protein
MRLSLLNNLHPLLAALLVLLCSQVHTQAQVHLERDHIRLVYSETEEGPLLLAVEALKKDIENVWLRNRSWPVK